MKTNINRRNFLLKSTKACVAGCALMAFPKFAAAGTTKLFLPADEAIDPKKLNYCGYQCPVDCKFLKASLENNIELKKQAYDDWKIKEQYGIEFDAENIYCFGCKTKDKPEGIVLTNCTVRSCSIEKGYNCCIECKELTTCTKELWDRFPDFKKYVIEMQMKYFEANKMS